MSTVITPFQGTDSFSTATFNNRISQINTGFSYISNPNLLDNWYFGNPVNQRGQTSYTGTGYGIDRLKSLTDSVVLITDNGINLKKGNHSYGHFSIVSDGKTYAIGKTVNISVLTTDGLFSASGVLLETSSGWSTAYASSGSYVRAQFEGGNLVFDFIALSDSDPDIIAAKLELGSQQTLAHQDESGNWALNEIPDYGEQLARCQRYARWMDGCYSGYIDDVNNIQLSVPEIKDMRTLPTISNIQWDRFVAIPYGDGGAFNVSSAYETAITYNGLRIGNTGLNISRYLPVATVFNFRAFLSADIL